MRSYFVWGVALAGLMVLTARCGGATDTLGNGSADASVDAPKEGGGSSTSSGGGSGGGSGSSSGSSSGGGSGSSSGSSSGGSSGSSSGSSSGGLPDAGACGVACTLDESCCNNQCVDTLNDPHNCGGCDNHCPDDKPTCSGGSCEVPPCDNTGGTCGKSQFCCGNSCCDQGQLCCVSEGGPVTLPKCITPTSQQPTCPVGCPTCQ